MFALFGLFIIGLGAATAIEYPIHSFPLHAQAAYVKPALIKHVEVEAPAHYDFSYSVHDDHTGDIKSQTESRKGDDVHGQYSLIDADGYVRTVDYTADEHNGFNAIVRRDPLGHKAVKTVVPVAKVLAPVHVAKIALAPKIALGPYGYPH